MKTKGKMRMIKSLTEIKAMARGYQEMGEINLQLSKDYFLTEEEGEKLSEMGEKKGKIKITQI